jgi:thioester reductase-like protein
MSTIFFTGFPGFLGSELLPRVLARSAEATAVCLVQPKFGELARSRARELEAAHPALAGRVQIVHGDITQADLGLGARGQELAASTVEIYHLAAVYDLSVGRALALRVNVDGTRHMLDFARTCPQLARFQYISTCYVSGRHAGLFTEDDLARGQTFNNFYEETKYLAEVEVQLAMRAGLAATVYRPAVVVGDSASGTTQKYDGPYFALQLVLRQRGIALLPVIGDPTKVEFNAVPRDFVLDAITYLSAQPAAVGQVFHLADPYPLTVDQMIDVMASSTGRRIIRVPLPLSVAKAAIDKVPGVQWLVGIPATALDYFVHPTRYGTAKTQKALEGSGIRCPRFPEYAPRLVDFMQRHPEIGAAAMA